MKLAEIICEGGLPISPTRGGTTDDHTFDDAVNYIKTNYKFTKKYSVPQISLSFFIDATTGKHLNKDGPARARKRLATTSSVDSFIDDMEFESNPYFSGDYQATRSIGYSWYTMENNSKSIAVLYYEDRGMGGDEALIGANDKKDIDLMRQSLINSGVIQSPEDLKFRKQEIAKGRGDLAAKKGIKIGSTIDASGDGTLLYRVIGVRPSGILDVEITHSEKFPDIVGQKRAVKPGTVLKKNVR